MSGSLGLSTDPLADAEKTDVRRFMGYEAYGSGNPGFFGPRFFTWYGLLEFRMTNLSSSELQVLRQYLATIYTLEAAVPTAGANMGTDMAAVWTRNKSEAGDRAKLYDSWCRRLCGFMGVPAGPALGAGGVAVVI